MKILYLTVSSDKSTKVVFEKPMVIFKIKINKGILTLNYKNIVEKAHVKASSGKREFHPGFWSVKEIAKKFKELSIDLSIEEYTQRAVITTPSSSAISLSDNLRDLLGSDTKTFQAGTTTTLATSCDILNGLKYFTVRCNEINGSSNLRSDENQRSIRTNILGIMGVKSFVFMGGTQYHDGNDFSPKYLVETAYFNYHFLLAVIKEVGSISKKLLLA